jgi:type II secretory pathway pseudopilin PulG
MGAMMRERAAPLRIIKYKEEFMRTKKSQRGFTITDFIVLLAMVSLVGGVLSYQVSNAIDSARQKKSITDLREWGAALSA